MKLLWTPRARTDRNVIYDYIEADNPRAALETDRLFQEKAALLTASPHLGRPSRISGLREFVVHPNYVLVYKVTKDEIWILRLLHAAQQWP